MKKFIKKLSFITITILAAILPVSSTFAQGSYNPLGDACTGEGASSDVCAADASDPVATDEGVLMNVVRIVTWVGGVAAVIMFLVGGLKYITANGDPNAISNAKNTLIYALIGAALLIFSRTIIVFVLGKI